MLGRCFQVYFPLQPPLQYSLSSLSARASGCQTTHLLQCGLARTSSGEPVEGLWVWMTKA